MYVYILCKWNYASKHAFSKHECSKFCKEKKIETKISLFFRFMKYKNEIYITNIIEKRTKFFFLI